MAQPYAEPCSRGVISAQPCPRATNHETTAAIKRWTLAACILASSMAFIDGSALTVALPQLKDDFAANLREVQWVINGYVLTLAAFTLIGGALADRYGRRDTLIVGCVLFALASIACAISPNIEALVVSRFAQGVGAAIITPASLALIGEVFPREERNQAIGAWAAASALTTAGGPVLGGWFAETIGWEGIFWINPPIALATIVILIAKGKAGERKAAKFDVIGAALLSIVLASAAYALSSLGPTEGLHTETNTQDGASALTLAVVLTAFISLFLFVRHERRITDPMLPPGIFSNGLFTRLNIATLLIYAGLSIMFFLLPFELVDVRGTSAITAGLALLPFTLSVGLLSRYSGKLADQIGAPPLMFTGSVLAAAGYLLMAMLRDYGLAVGVIAPIAVAGLGFSFLVAPLTASVMSSVDDRDSGLASGINNTASRIAQLFGVALAAGVAFFSEGFTIGMVVAGMLSALGAICLLGFGSANSSSHR